MIMAVVQTIDEDMFVKSYGHISSSGVYLNRYSGDTTLNSVVTINGGTHCAGSLITGYGSELLTIYGDLYVNGDFKPQCPVYVTGNVYCGGNLVTSWGKDFKVGKNLYVEGNVSLQVIQAFTANTFIQAEILKEAQHTALTASAKPMSSKT